MKPQTGPNWSFCILCCSSPSSSCIFLLDIKRVCVFAFLTSARFNLNKLNLTNHMSISKEFYVSSRVWNESLVVWLFRRRCYVHESAFGLQTCRHGSKVCERWGIFSDCRLFWLTCLKLNFFLTSVITVKSAGGISLIKSKSVNLATWAADVVTLHPWTLLHQTI